MAETKSLDQIFKEVNKKCSAVTRDGNTIPAMSVGRGEIGVSGTLSFGTPGLDYCIYNSFPEGRFVSIIGKEGSGKTSVSSMLAANYQKKEIMRHPDNPRKILYVDLETTLDPEWAIKMGYDATPNAKVPTIYFTPMDMPAEQILDIVRDAIHSDEVGLVIIDSLPMLTGQQTYNESFEKKDMGGISKLLKDFTSRTTSLLKMHNCTLIGINAVRESLDPYGPPVVEPGGTAWKLACSLRLMIKRGEFVDEEGNTLKSSAESPAGYRLEMAVLKNKISRWDRKIGSTLLNYVGGIDYIQDTIDIAIKLGLIDNSVQGSFKLIDIDTHAVLLDEMGNELKIRGRKNIKPWFKSHPEEFQKLYNKVYEVISVKDTTNLQQFEALMNNKETTIEAAEVDSLSRD